MKFFILLTVVALCLTGCGSNGSAVAVAAAAPASSQVSPPDPSPHQQRMVEVEPGVTLEVLDWGGSGPPLVLLTGLGDNAHVYDNFASQFTDGNHVYGITRRGFGRSSKPETGYDVASRALDDVRVMDALGIDKAIFVGHSFAGDELSELGSAYPNRVSKLVYLDAYDYGQHAKLAVPPGPAFTEADTASVARFVAVAARHSGTRSPLASIYEGFVLGPTGNIIDSVSPPEVTDKMKAGTKDANFPTIQAPALGIFAPYLRDVPQPFYYYLTPAQKLDYDLTFPPIIDWQENAIERFRGIPNSSVVLLPGAYHYVYISNEELVVRKMLDFIR